MQGYIQRGRRICEGEFSKDCIIAIHSHGQSRVNREYRSHKIFFRAIHASRRDCHAGRLLVVCDRCEFLLEKVGTESGQAWRAMVAVKGCGVTMSASVLQNGQWRRSTVNNQHSHGLVHYRFETSSIPFVLTRAPVDVGVKIHGQRNGQAL